jgi:tetratricopeptide (TPR) repeat protein
VSDEEHQFATRVIMKHRTVLLLCLIPATIAWNGAAPAEPKAEESGKTRVPSPVPAPALEVLKWVRGKAVDLAKGKGKSIHVVDFWSVQNRLFRYMLHSNNEFAARFRKHGVVFVGNESYGEKGEAIPARKELERFADIVGKKLEYALALDDQSKTLEAYTKATGAKEGPHAYIVDKQGKIVWHGVPGLELWAQLGDLVGEKEFAAQAREMQKAKDRVLGLVAFGNKYDEGLELIDKILEFDPLDLDNKRRLGYKVLAAKKKDLEAAAKWGKDLVSRVNDPDLLDDFASDLLTNELGYGPKRDFALALEAAKKANELAKAQDWSILATYAQALLANEKSKEAEEAAKKALALAKKAGVEGEALEGLEQLLAATKDAK